VLKKVSGVITNTVVIEHAKRYASTVEEWALH
jgi:hypothetical protein